MENFLKITKHTSMVIRYSKVVLNFGIMPIGTQQEGQNCYDRAGHDLIIGTFQSAEAASLSYLIDQITRLQAKIGSPHEHYTYF